MSAPYRVSIEEVLGTAISAANPISVSSAPIAGGAGAGASNSTTQRVIIATDQTSIPTTPADTTVKTYSAAISGLVIAASATDVFEIAGSATKTVKVRRITLSGQATAATAIAVVTLKRSTANSGGTSTSPAAIPHDSADAAGTAVVKAYTANPTTGTSLGAVRAARLTVTTSAGAIANVARDIEPSGSGKPFVLNGVAQSLVLNLAGVTVMGLAFDLAVEWTEE